MSSTIHHPKVRQAFLFTDIVGSTALKRRLGNTAAARLIERHNDLFRQCLGQWQGHEVDNAGDGFLATFTQAADALGCALGFQQALGRLPEEEPLLVRMAIHMGEVVALPATPDAPNGKFVGVVVDTAAHLLQLAGGRQILLTREAFDEARLKPPTGQEMELLQWLAHGAYNLEGHEERLEVYEVGLPCLSLLATPSGRGKAQRLMAPGEEELLGWRPATNEILPGRPLWRLERLLGRGGFGEVWLARHGSSGEARAFKFCFELERLRALRREYKLLSMLGTALGEHPGIVRVHDVRLEAAPYYLELEYAEGGDLVAWSERQGGLASVSLERRLGLFIQICDALAAAHAIGILHKDIKPGNVLLRERDGGAPQALLTDFGIGQILDGALLMQHGMAEPFTCGATLLTDTQASGTHLYRAPELILGRPPSIQSDIYALGILLYQMVAGELERALAQGWERDIEDELLRADIALCVDGESARRLSSVAQLVERLRALEQRRARAQEERRQQEQAVRYRRRRRLLGFGAAVACILLAVVSAIAVREARHGRLETGLRKEVEGALKLARQQREEALHQAYEAETARQKATREAETSRQTVAFMVRLFEVSDPSESLGQRITAREILDRGAARLNRELAGEPHVRAALLETIGQVYLSLGLVRQALPFAEQALALRRRDLPPEDPARTLCLMRTARTLLANARPAEAARLLEEAIALERNRSATGGVQDGLVLADLLEQMSRVQEALKDYEAAVALAHETLAIRRRVLGDRHVGVGMALDNLARVNLPKARDMWYDRSISIAAQAILSRDLGTTHPLMAEIYSRVGYIDKIQGDYPLAIKEYTQALAIQRQIFHEEHPQLAVTLGCLGILNRLLARYPEAQASFEEAIAIDRHLLGENSFATLKESHYYGLLLIDLGRYAEAVKLYRRLVAEFPKVEGEKGRWAMESWTYLGKALTLNGDYREAEQALERSLDLRQQVYSPIYPWTLETRCELGRLYLATGRLEQARAHLQFGTQNGLGLAHPFDDTRHATLLLGQCLLRQGRPAEALRQFTAVLDATRQRYGEEHPLAATALHGLGEANTALRRAGQGEKHLQRALAIRLKFFGPRHPSTLESRRALAALKARPAD